MTWTLTDRERLVLVVLGQRYLRHEPNPHLVVTSRVQVGIAPFHVALSPDGTRAYVCNACSNNVSIIDTERNFVIATVPVGVDSENAVVSPEGDRVYVGNVDSNTISVLDPARAATAASPIGGQRRSAHVRERGWVVNRRVNGGRATRRARRWGRWSVP